MSLDASAVPGLVRSDAHGPGITRAGGHFTAKEFRTWNATVLMALALANAEPSAELPGRKRAIAASVRAVADWLGDTPAVARSSYIDPRLIVRYESGGRPPVGRMTGLIKNGRATRR